MSYEQFTPAERSASYFCIYGSPEGDFVYTKVQLAPLSRKGKGISFRHMLPAAKIADAVRSRRNSLQLFSYPSGRTPRFHDKLTYSH